MIADDETRSRHRYERAAVPGPQRNFEEPPRRFTWRIVTALAAFLWLAWYVWRRVRG